MSSSKRPPKPTDYKHGDYHPPTGRMFKGYVFQGNKWKLQFHRATNIFEMQIEKMLSNALQRAKKNNLPFDIDIAFLKSITTQTCPVFGIQLNWGVNPNGSSKSNSASLDRVIPEWGYIKGNVVIISQIANLIKQNVTYNDLYKVADWLHDQEKETRKNVKSEQLTSIPTRSYKKSQDNTTHGVVHGAGSGQDCDGIDDYSELPLWANINSSAEKSGGVSMGSGVPEMGAPETLQGGEGDGDTQAKADSIGKFIEHLHNQSREFGVAVGMWENVRLPNHRRELEVQGPVHEKVQGIKEALEIFQAEVDIDWDAVAARFTRPMEPDWYTGLGPEAGDEPNKV